MPRHPEPESRDLSTDIARRFRQLERRIERLEAELRRRRSAT